MTGQFPYIPMRERVIRNALTDFDRLGIHVFRAFTASESRIFGTRDANSLAAGSVAKHHVETWDISGHSLLA